MFVRFKRDVELKAITDVCCFSGEHSTNTCAFKKGDILEVKYVQYDPSTKVKTRPGQPGVGLRMCEIILKGKNENTVHPDYLQEVPNECFEVRK